MTFTESNTAEAYLRDLLCGTSADENPLDLQDARANYGVASTGVGWTYLPGVAIPREPQEVFAEPLVREALIRLNPEIATKPERAEEVLYKLRAIVLSVRSDGLIRANEEFTAWLRGERSMPFGKDGEHVTVRIVDFEDLSRNQYIVTAQYPFRAGPAERRADLVLLVNGSPLVLIEAKTPVRPSVSWVDGAIQVHDDYEQFVPELFACNLFSVATEGKALRYGSIQMPVHLWGPWRTEDQGDDAATGMGLADLERAVSGLLAPATVLDILASFVLFATDKKKRRLKVVCRYQQYEAANRIVERVVAGQPKRGLIWHFQGSGKSLLMVFAAQKLRMHPALPNAFLFGLTGTPINTRDRNTFYAFGAPEDVNGYLSRYGFEESIRDGATLPLHFEPRLVALQRAARHRPRHRRGRGGEAPGRGRGPRQGRADGAIRGGPQPEDARHGRARRQRHRRDRPRGTLPRLAANQRRRAGSQEGPAWDPVQIQAAQRCGAVREGLRIHSPVLLRTPQESGGKQVREALSEGGGMERLAAFDGSWLEAIAQFITSPESAYGRARAPDA